MKRVYHSLLFFLVLTSTLASLVGSVYAPDEDINLENLPAQLADAWGITSFAAGLFMSVLLMFPFLIATAMLGKRMSGFIFLLVGFGIMGFCIAIGWMPYWIMLMLSLLVATLYASKFKGML